MGYKYVASLIAEDDACVVDWGGDEDLDNDNRTARTPMVMGMRLGYVDKKRDAQRVSECMEMVHLFTVCVV